MDLDKLTMGSGSFGLTMPILLLLVFTAVAAGIIIVMGGTRKTLWTVIIGALILLICVYCIFLACHSVVHVKKTVKLEAHEHSKGPAGAGPLAGEGVCAYCFISLPVAVVRSVNSAR